mgnify:CR=1 FL=1
MKKFPTANFRGIRKTISISATGVDGFIRVWDLDAIDQADTTEDSTTFDLDPMNALKVTDAEITSMIMSSDDDSTWYAQDQRGAIWELDPEL